MCVCVHQTAIPSPLLSLSLFVPTTTAKKRGGQSSPKPCRYRKLLRVAVVDSSAARLRRVCPLTGVTVCVYVCVCCSCVCLHLTTARPSQGAPFFFQGGNQNRFCLSPKSQKGLPCLHKQMGWLALTGKTTTSASAWLGGWKWQRGQAAQNIIRGGGEQLTAVLYCTGRNKTEQISDLERPSQRCCCFGGSGAADLDAGALAALLALAPPAGPATPSSSSSISA